MSRSREFWESLPRPSTADEGEYHVLHRYLGEVLDSEAYQDHIEVADGEIIGATLSNLEDWIHDLQSRLHDFVTPWTRERR